MNAPSVTAIIATRNRPRMLRRAVDAVFAQQYPGRLDAVIVFDGEAPPAWAAGLTPGRAQVLANERSPGLAGARNTGLLAATGDCVAFCDDDDLWLPGKLARQTELLERSGAVVAATGIVIRHGDRSFERQAPAGAVAFADLLRDRIAALHPSTFLADRTGVLDQVGLVDEANPGGYGEDYDWLLRAARADALVALPDALTEVTWHEGSYFSGRWALTAAGLSWLIERYPEFRQDPRGAARIHGQHAFALAAAGRRRPAFAAARAALAMRRTEPRAYLAMAVAAGLLRPEWVVRRLNAQGRGI